MNSDKDKEKNMIVSYAVIVRVLSLSLLEASLGEKKVYHHYFM